MADQGIDHYGIRLAFAAALQAEVMTSPIRPLVLSASLGGV